MNTRALLWFVVGIAALGCGSKASKPPPTPQCVLDSDCNNPLRCLDLYCVKACNESRDCPSNERCIVMANMSSSCQPLEKEMCQYTSQCTPPLVCSFDFQCRNQCNTDVDCAHGQKCTSLTHLCADPALDPTYDPATNEFKNATPAAETDGSVDLGHEPADAGAGDVPVAADASDAPAAGGDGPASGGDVPAGIDAPMDGPASLPDGGTMVVDPCVPAGDGGLAPEQVMNDDRDHATPLPLNTSLVACLQTGTDLDYYDFTVPNIGQGGFVTVSLSNVGASTQVWADLSSAATNGTMWTIQNPNAGASAYGWFAAAAGAEFHVMVYGYFKDARSIGPYTITATYLAQPVPALPDRAHAATLALATPASGVFFRGYQDDTVLTDHLDWYKLTLPMGNMTATVTNVAMEVRGWLILYDATGMQITDFSQSTAGGDVVLMHAIPTAGTYYVSVGPRFPGDLLPKAANNRTLPSWSTQPYTLQVTSP
jgi:hypothetical protein